MHVSPSVSRCVGTLALLLVGWGGFAGCGDSAVSSAPPGDGGGDDRDGGPLDGDGAPIDGDGAPIGDDGGTAIDAGAPDADFPPGATIVITQSAPGEIYRLDLTSYNIQPGDVLAIPAGDYPGGITLGTFGGSAQRRVTVINQGGVVTTPYIRIYDATHFHLTGTGGGGTYGFRVIGPSGAGVAITRATSDYEVDHIEVTGVDAGLIFKSDPQADEPITHYPNHVIRNVLIHDMWIHDVTGEGMYIGHTYPNADPYHGNIVPVRMDHVTIRDNLVEGTGWDGIQLSNARDGAVITGNTVRDFGLNNFDSQRAGIILGGNTSGMVTDNVVERGTGNGIEVFGYGDCTVSGNTVVDTATTANEDALYLDPRAVTIEDNPALRVTVTGNTVKEASRVLIRSANNLGTQAPGSITGNTLCDSQNRALAQLVVSGAGDVIADNTLNGAACE